jgi:ABC-2 type transport system permease protein
MNTRVVNPGETISLTFGLLVRQLITRGRVIALLAVGIVVALVALAVGSGNGHDATRRAVQFIANLGFTTVVPIVSLVFASAALGDTRDDRTLVYLWLRPTSRWPIVIGAWLAAITASLPLTLVPLGAAALLSGGGGTVMTATLLAAFVGVVAYSALFLLFGLLVRNSIVWGLAYIVIWEGIIAAFGDFAARLAIRGYTRSILTSRTGVDLSLGDLSLGAAIIVPLVGAAVALALTARRLQVMDVD